MITPIRIRSAIQVLGVSMIALLVSASPLTIRSAHASAVPGVLPDAAADSLLVLLPPRAQEAVRQDLADAEALANEANGDLVFAQGRQGEVKAHIEVRKSEIEATKAKIKLAKEQKNATEQVDLEQQVKAQELRLKVLETRKEMRDAEVVLADARRKAGQTQSGFFKKELELLAKRSDLQKMGSVGGGVANFDGLVRLQGETRELERRGMEILKGVAEAEKKVADAEVSLLDKRLKLHEVQLELFKSPKE
jgi:hypothetical protein